MGDGPVDLVYAPGFLSHVEWSWEQPAFARFLRRLASFSRLILFDKRGTGLSDPVSGTPTPEERMADIQAVMDAAGSEQAALLGVFDGGPLALLFAAAHPERTSALILYGSLAKFTQSADYPWGWSPAAIQLYLAASEESWGSGEGAELLAPSLSEDDNYRRWFARLVRMSASPGQAMALLKMNTELDVRDVLDSGARPHACPPPRRRPHRGRRALPLPRGASSRREAHRAPGGRPLALGRRCRAGSRRRSRSS